MARVSSTKPKTQKKEVTVSSPKRKRVEAEKNSLIRSKTGSAFARCEECKKDVPVMLVDMHDCSQESKIKMKMGRKEGRLLPKQGRLAKLLHPKQRRLSKQRIQTCQNVLTSFSWRSSGKLTRKNIQIIRVSKASGEKWKSLSDEDKKVYQNKAAVLKEQYLKAMEKYNLANEKTEFFLNLYWNFSPVSTFMASSSLSLKVTKYKMLSLMYLNRNALRSSISNASTSSQH